MSFALIDSPPPCSAWPADLLHAVGEAFREAAGRGLDTVECMNLARAALRQAGSDLDQPDPVIAGMIASLSKERSQWLWGPMDEWWAANVPVPPEAAGQDAPPPAPGLTTSPK